MNRLRRELGVANRSGLAISAALALVGACLLFLVAGGSTLPVRLALSAAMGLFISVYGFLVSYVYGDAGRRGMRAGAWALLAALVPNALGLIAYFLLREPLLQRCGACGASARREFAFCPRCGSALRRVCPSCGRPLDGAWSHCAQCGTKVAEAAAGAG
jgi:hypothetical protein